MMIVIEMNVWIGASEMLMATAVSQLAEKTPGKESVAIESFARALRQVINYIHLFNKYISFQI